MKYWEMHIYQSIEALGGEADLQDIYDEIPNHIDLTERHLRITKWGERPAYQHLVRSYIPNMCQDRLFHQTLRGRYKITKYIAA